MKVSVNAKLELISPNESFNLEYILKVELLNQTVKVCQNQ